MGPNNGYSIMIDEPFFLSPHCGQGRIPQRCKACRTDRVGRERIMQQFPDVHTIDFDCPYQVGVPSDGKLRVPAWLKCLGLAELTDEIRKYPLDEKGSELLSFAVSWREDMDGCSGCTLNSKLAEIRLWIANRLLEQQNAALL